MKAYLANQRFQEHDALLFRLEVGAGAPSYPQTAKDHFRRAYYETIHLIVRAIYQRVNQESFSSYAQMETLFVKAANGGEQLWHRLQVSWSIIQQRCWYRCATLATKYFGSYVKGVEDIMFWRNPVGVVLKFPEPEKKLIQEVQTICKLLAVNPATSAAGEGSFSSVRCLETWLRCRMADERFSNLEVLNGHRSFFR